MGLLSHQDLKARPLVRMSRCREAQGCAGTANFSCRLPKPPARNDIVYNTISTYLIRKAGYTNIVILSRFQCFGGALNANILCGAPHKILRLRAPPKRWIRVTEPVCGLSRVLGNSHARFLGEWWSATAATYPINVVFILLLHLLVVYTERLLRTVHKEMHP